MSDAKTIAIVAGQLVVGGAERQLYLWLSSLDRNRFRPVVITLHPECDDYWERPIQALGVDVIPVARESNKVMRLAAIGRALRSYRPSLIHGWHLFASPYAGAAARLLRARASLGSVRGSFATYADNAMAAALTNALTDGLVVNSAAAAKKIEGDRRWFQRRVFIVPNAVEPVTGGRTNTRSRFAQYWKIPEARVWLGSIGRFEASKRFDMLVELTASLVARGEDLHLVLFGDGRARADLESLARKRGIESRLTFTGTDPEARLWIEAFDVFCFTSTDEGLPNAVMEAAAAGVPVLAWRTDFICELLTHGRSALLADPGDMRALGEGLSELIRNRDLRQQIGAEARREVVANFGVRAYTQRLTEVYEMLLEAPGRGAA